MAEMNGEKLLNEIDGLLADDAKASVSEDSALPFEMFDDYSIDPVCFNEQSKLMLDKVDAVFNLAVKYNRRSSQYLKACAKLEQGIKFLASGCLTKIALELNKQEFPELGQLTTDKLYRMASYHFRKIDRALSEYIQEKQGEVDDDLLDMEFRYYNLLNRLRATEVRIYNYDFQYRLADRRNYDPIMNGLAFTKDSWTKSINEYQEAASFQKARAFSALYGAQRAHRDSSDAAANAAQQDCHACCEADDAAEPAHQNCSTAENEESRNKDEEKSLLTPDSSLHTDNVPDSSLRTEQTAPAKRRHIPLITEPAAYLDTLMKALHRGTDAGEPEGTLIFTNEEMIQLVNDPVFCSCERDLAANLRQVVAQMDST